ncbi:maleylpyruvate isomerase family mycothiol-dependent enzyme [Nocardia sp. NBC_00565]|uniref:maleylpyruvate isomerase family mycothiol-dependent enzyme n=1 Tax=Nocardia sp. NBC_00565 TaxID=2975993 RepID=UPI002E810480|nr:maleylpyruvate isomerase family mycothiol-dependent enzyme [Nocardia sp. NBC_00565]WUC01775.1 maleylpyruvate isomerase family mycothiol-dependent enzyme [Nocardia sp. NBC_00565]
MTIDAPETTVQLDTVATATARLLETARGLDADMTLPSLLPGWSRGHVLAHLARNADSLVNLLLWARTGIETPQYASMFIRDADIEAGAPRPLADQLADNEAAANRWLALARTAPETAWTATVRTRQGRPIPATEVIWMRLQEVEIHHVDLAADYQPADWPSDFVARLLPRATADLTKAAASDPMPTFAVHTTDTDFTATIGSGACDHTVSGPAAALLAWLLGRSEGADLSGALPTLPSWK